MSRLDKWRARWQCHHSLVCCQHTDNPNCNSGRKWGLCRGCHRPRWFGWLP